MPILTKQEVVELCLTYPGTYVDHPFCKTGQPGVVDYNWTLIRLRGSGGSIHAGERRLNPDRVFAWIFEREWQGQTRVWVNLKDAPDWLLGWRETFPRNVIPAYHMSKAHWNSLILDGGMTDAQVKEMIRCSFYAVRDGVSWRQKT